MAYVADDNHPQPEQETAAAALEAENRREDCSLTLGFVSGGSWNPVQPITFPDKPSPAGDIVMSKEYPVYLKAFCSRYDDSSLHSNLTSWMQQREQNGWTLTLWGSGRIAEKAGAAGGRRDRNHGGYCQAVYQAQMEGLSRSESAEPSQRGKAVEAGGKRTAGL